MSEWTKELEAKLIHPDITVDEVFELTKNIDEHPEYWDCQCFCMLCQSYAD